MAKLTDLQWDVFRLIEQEGKNKGEAAEELGITYDEVSDILTNLRRKEPKLFPVNSERAYMRRHVFFGRRKRENIKIVSYDAKTSHNGELKEEIRQKF